MVDLPAAEVWSVDRPFPALAIGGENEGAFTSADENADGGHVSLLVFVVRQGNALTPGAIWLAN